MGWTGGLAEWADGETVYLSVAFTWRLYDAYNRAVWARESGKRVMAGGPALFHPRMRRLMSGVAEIGTTCDDAIRRHNPQATVASRGCPVGCWFCAVPKMEGREFTLLPDFPVRPILCDNNLSALPPEYQDHIIEKYAATRTRLRDANSGFEPQTFTDDVYRRWKPLVNEGRGPWRFAYDELGERDDVIRVMEMLRDEPARRKRVYVLIGNEPFADCMTRIEEVIAGGCEPHVQPYIKLTALERKPQVRFDWTEQKLRDLARWANGFVWRVASFKDYHHRKRATSRSDPQQTDLGYELTR